MNKKGFSVLSVIISLVIFGITIIVVSNFNVYISTHKKNVFDKETFYSEIDNEMSILYSEDWTFESKVVKTRSGDLHISKVDLGLTEYNTRKMKVDFKLKELNKTIEIERSQYYE